MKAPTGLVVLLAGMAIGWMLPHGCERPPDEKPATTMQIGNRSVITCGRWSIAFEGAAKVLRDYGRFPISDFHFPHNGYVFTKRKTVLDAGDGTVEVTSYPYTTEREREVLLNMLTGGRSPRGASSSEFTSYGTGGRERLYIATGAKYVTACVVPTDLDGPIEFVTW